MEENEKDRKDNDRAYKIEDKREVEESDTELLENMLSEWKDRVRGKIKVYNQEEKTRVALIYCKILAQISKLYEVNSRIN